MENQNVSPYLKYGIMAVIVAGFGTYVVPWLIKMTLDLLTLGVLALTGFAFVMALPAISEFLAQLSNWAWEMAIRGNPCVRLRRDLEAFNDQIDEMEKQIAKAGASVKQVENQLKAEQSNLSPDEINDWVLQINDLKQAVVQLVGLRDQARDQYAEFERQVKKAEAQYKLGKAFKGALGAFKSTDISKNVGAGVALDEIQKNLAESQARLQVILSRKDPKKPWTTSDLNLSAVAKPAALPSTQPAMSLPSPGINDGAVVKSSVFSRINP